MFSETSYITVTGTAQIERSLSRVPADIQKAASKVIRDGAQAIANEATETASQFPRNLNKTKNHEAGPVKFKVRKKGPLAFQIIDGGGLGGKAAAIVEYANQGVSPQGKHLVSVIKDRFPNPLSPGRNAWKIYKDNRKQMSAAMQVAVDMCLVELKKAGA